MSLQVRRLFFLSLLGMILARRPVCFPPGKGRGASYLPCREGRVPIVSFSTSDLTSTIWAFFLAPASAFPRCDLSQPLLKTHALLFSDFHDSCDSSQTDRRMWIFTPPPLLVSRDGKCFPCSSWTERRARLRELWCEEMSGAAAGQRLGQWQPTLGAKFCFFLAIVCASRVLVWSAHGQDSRRGNIFLSFFLFSQLKAEVAETQLAFSSFCLRCLIDRRDPPTVCLPLLASFNKVACVSP